MRKYEQLKKTGKIVSAAIAAAIVCMTATPAFASAKDTNAISSDLQQYAKLKENEKTVVAKDGMVEHYCKAEDLGLDVNEVFDEKSDGLLYRTQTVNGGPFTYVWTVNPKTRHVSGSFKMKNAGGYIGATSIIVPGDKTHKLGIMDMNGNARFVTGTGGAAHEFANVAKGTYRVFVQNDYKDVTLGANVVYRYSYNDNTK